MKCPVCEIELEIPIQDLDEVYYDCSNCDSSLLFKNGECEILSEGKKGTSQKAVSEKSILRHKSTLQKDQIQETTEEKDHPFEEESSSKIIFKEENNNQQTGEELEVLQESNEEEELDSEDQLPLEGRKSGGREKYRGGGLSK